MTKQKIRKLSSAVRGRLKMAAAAAQEAVTQLHVERALEFVELAEGRVPPLRMLDVYLRLQALPPSEGTIVRNRTLAALGAAVTPSRRPAMGDQAAEPAEEGEQPEERSIWRTVRRRLRGRVNTELRRVVELHTGATQRLLLETHVRQARGIVTVLGEDQPIETACILYCELLHVPATLAAVLYPLVLDRIAAEQLPRSWVSTRASASVAPRTPQTPVRPGSRQKQVRPPA